MKIIAVIPARLNSQRFPNKLIQPLGDSTVIGMTYTRVKDSKLFDEVIVATDSDQIQDLIENQSGTVFRSVKEHECGSDRVAEAIESTDADIVINVQGDEPFTSLKTLETLIDVFKNDTSGEIDLVSPMHVLEEEIDNPNFVKVITDLQNRALYFSRSTIPYHRNKDVKPTYYRHVGIYAFRKNALIDFYKSSPTPLEMSEQIEAIRYLEMGKTIKMIEIDEPSLGIDTKEDYNKAVELLNSK